MGFFDDGGDALNNLVFGLGDSISGKNQAEVAKMQLANQQAAIAALEKINTKQSGKSNTGLIIGGVVVGVFLLVIVAYVAFIKPRE